MCGIAGHAGRARGPQVRASMLAALRVRGPDAEHIATFDRHGDALPPNGDAPVGLVHARLSVIDPRPVADQPMPNADRSVWLCYNGEIYGWQDDARALAARGARFLTRSDTEYLLHAYDAYGIAGLLPRLRGMFAFALVDFRAGCVHLARDRMGLKPLVYAHLPGEFAFGSTVRSLLAWLPPDRRGRSAESIDAYLAHRYIPAPRTILTHVARLPNGHRLTYDLASDRIALARYYVPAPAADDCAARLDEAVELRTVADRPVGVFLSGGVDSAVVAARLAELGHAGLPTFSAVFPGSEYDESGAAAATARALGLPNQAVPVPLSPGADFEAIVAALDEPFADPSAFPTWYLARATVRQVTVVLGGDGGDELFGGYKRHRAHLRHRWRGRMRLPLPILPQAASKGWRKVVGELALDWESAYALRFSGLSPNQRAFVQPGLASPAPHYWRAPDAAGTSALDRLVRVDLANYLPEYVLRKADLMTMAHGLELRAPLLDHRFVEAVLGLPPRVRFSTPPKRFLAGLAPALAPLRVIERGKHGFNPPLRPWLDEPETAARLPLLGAALAARTGGQLDAARVDALVRRDARDGRLAEQVLSLVVLEASLRQLDVEGARVA